MGNVSLKVLEFFVQKRVRTLYLAYSIIYYSYMIQRCIGVMIMIKCTDILVSHDVVTQTILQGTE